MEEGRELSDVVTKRRNSGEDEEGIDYITSLPVSVFLHILSFLPKKDAATTICIPNFLYVWTSFDALYFSQCNFHTCHHHHNHNQANHPDFNLHFINFVNRVLKKIHGRHEIDKFSLSMHIPFPPRDQTPQSRDDKTLHVEAGEDVWPYRVAARHKTTWKRISNTVDYWIRFALQKKTKILDLDFMACGSKTWKGSDCYVLPSDVMNCSHLMELHLDNCRFEQQLQGIAIHLVSLLKLSLVRIALSEKMIDRIISGCVVLKELSLVECRGLKELKLHGRSPLETLSVSFHSLEKMEISLGSFKSLRARVFQLREISCSRVSSLVLYGPVTNVMLNYHHSVGEANVCLGCNFRPCHATFSDIRCLLERLCRVNHFKPCTWFILIFSIWELTGQWCPLLYWKNVTAALGLTKWIVPGICKLLQCSDLLETLVIYIYPFRCHPRPGLSLAQWLENHDFKVAKYWDSSPRTFDCLEHHLKKVKICGIVMEPYIMELIEFLLGNALILEEMVIALRETPRQHQDECLFAYEDGEVPVMTPDMVAECSRQVLGFSRASAAAEIRFV